MSGGRASMLPPWPCLGPAWHTNDPLDPHIHIDSHEQALQCLINRAVSQVELPSLIEKIFSDWKVTEIVDCLQQNDMQVFIDVIDGVHC